VFNNIENHSLDVFFGPSITYEKHCCEGKVTEEFFSQVQQKNSGVSAGVDASENGAVQ